MKKELEPQNNSIIPKRLAEMTLQELISQDAVEIRKKNNKTTIKKVTPAEAITVEIRTYDTGYEVSKREFRIPDKKKEFEDDIVKMYEEGRKQTEIADTLGISQSYVSIILKNRK